MIMCYETDLCATSPNIFSKAVTALEFMFGNAFRNANPFEASPKVEMFWLLHVAGLVQP